jgi:hypothetical protein
MTWWSKKASMDLRQSSIQLYLPRLSICLSNSYPIRLYTIHLYSLFGFMPRWSFLISCKFQLRATRNRCIPCIFDQPVLLVSIRLADEAKCHLPTHIHVTWLVVSVNLIADQCFCSVLASFIRASCKEDPSRSLLDDACHGMLWNSCNLISSTT